LADVHCRFEPDNSLVFGGNGSRKFRGTVALHERHGASAEAGSRHACSKTIAWFAANRGTPNRSDKSRPVLVLGVDPSDARNADRHDLQLTRGLYESLPEWLRPNLTCRIVPQLEPIVQAHSIEGLVMGEA
jgi:hypothetical protein